jgi:hypothetical protein
MKRSCLVLAACLTCGGSGTFLSRSDAAAPPVEDLCLPFPAVPKPPTPTDPIDIAARGGLGEEARWWEFIGSLWVNGELVALYHADSDRSGWLACSMLNEFSLHTATRDGRGRWVSRRVYSCSSCRFGRILKQDEWSVTVGLLPRPLTVTIDNREGRLVVSRDDDDYPLPPPFNDKGEFPYPRLVLGCQWWPELLASDGE